MNTAGIVSYKIGQDGSLLGRWTHRDLQGKLATGRAWGGTPGQPAGRYRVEIQLADGQNVFEGVLTISPFGEAYALVWSGKELLPRPRAAQFAGIGTVVDGDRLVATFQEEELRTCRATLRDVFDKIPAPQGERYAEAFTHGTLRVLLYAPRKVDPQQPHEQDEVYVVMKGSGSFIVEDSRRHFAKGDVLFVPEQVSCSRRWADCSKAETRKEDAEHLPTEDYRPRDESPSRTPIDPRLSPSSHHVSAPVRCADRLVKRSGS
jgi:mannose-6-phosphate isomerase-like protein (cupin superfamily)